MTTETEEKVALPRETTDCRGVAVLIQCIATDHSGNVIAALANRTRDARSAGDEELYEWLNARVGEACDHFQFFSQHAAPSGEEWNV